MNKGTLALLISGLLAIPATMAKTPNSDLNLMPYPKKVALGQGKIPLNSAFSIYIKGYDSPRVQAHEGHGYLVRNFTWPASSRRYQ